MITNGDSSRVYTDNESSNDGNISFGASMAAPVAGRAPMCTLCNMSDNGTIHYQSDGFDTSRATPRSMLLERSLRLKNWNTSNPESNYLSTLLVSTRVSDTPPNSTSISKKRNPNWGTIATLIKR